MWSTCQDRKPLTSNLASEDAQLEERAARMCAELQKDKTVNEDLTKARNIVIYDHIVNQIMKKHIFYLRIM